MRIKIHHSDWRTVMKVCGGLCATVKGDKFKIMEEYIDMHFANNECIAYGSNGSQLARVVFPCVMDDSSLCFSLMVKPEKVLAGTKSVELYIDLDTKKYDIIYIDDTNDVIDSTSHEFFDGIPVDYEQFYRRAIDDCEKHFVVVNPKLLINALEGLKSYEHIIMNFGSTNQPFIVRPYDADMDVMNLVFPVRTQ